MKKLIILSLCLLMTAGGVEIALATSSGEAKYSGIASMTLMYADGSGANITAHKAVVMDLGGGLYKITPGAGDTKLESNTKIYVGGVLATKIKTSGSKPIDIGDVHGDFTIVDLKKILKD